MEEPPVYNRVLVEAEEQAPTPVDKMLVSTFGQLLLEHHYNMSLLEEHQPAEEQPQAEHVSVAIRRGHGCCGPGHHQRQLGDARSMQSTHTIHR